MWGGGGLEKIKYGGGGVTKKYDWCVRKKNKMYGGASAKEIQCSGFFPSALRISNGIDLSGIAAKIFSNCLTKMSISGPHFKCDFVIPPFLQTPENL